METGTTTTSWRTIMRIIAKAAILVLSFNLIFAALRPQESLGRLSLYNLFFPGRLRLPYGENAQESYNLSLFNVPAMINSHIVSQPKADSEFRVFVIGDSGAWGWLLENDDTLASQLNELGLTTEDGRQVVVYNLGYPIMSLTKDLMILDAALNYEPDLIIWPVTLESFPREKQLFSPIVQNNPQRIRTLIDHYNLQLDLQDPRFVDPTFHEQTIIGQRRDLADLIRLQLFGLSWAATGIDQAIPAEISLRRSDFEEDISWQEFEDPIPLSENELAFDVLAAGTVLAGDVPLLIVNEPMFISDGLNSDLRYNSFYPRWAYDQYRVMLREQATVNKWAYTDLWDSIPPAEFTDTPVHLTPGGTRQLANILSGYIKELIAQ